LIAKLVSMEPVPGCPRYIVTFARNLTLSSKWVGLEVLAICAWETTLQVEFRIRGRVTFTTYHLDHSVHHIPDSVYSRTIFHQLLPLRSSNPILKKKMRHPEMRSNTQLVFSPGVMETRKSLRFVTLVHPLLQLTAPWVSDVGSWGRWAEVVSRVLVVSRTRKSSKISKNFTAYETCLMDVPRAFS
jgi:hypothetical protein